ncbi:MAG: hypothetical protein KUG77_30175 [Nannocystaceae bacterium]|nr:hypothetical protein [Nannocystaceae bacterium]
MGSLADKLTAPEVRRDVVEACCNLVQSEVDSKRGFSGAAIKLGYRAVKALKPGFVGGAVNGLLPEFADAMQPLYDKNDEDAGKFASYITANAAQTADLLLQVTDGKADRANNATIKKTYSKLRGSAKDNVEAAVPGLANALRPFLGE